MSCLEIELRSISLKSLLYFKTSEYVNYGFNGIRTYGHLCTYPVLKLKALFKLGVRFDVREKIRSEVWSKCRNQNWCIMKRVIYPLWTFKNIASILWSDRMYPVAHQNICSLPKCTICTGSPYLQPVNSVGLSFRTGILYRITKTNS